MTVLKSPAVENKGARDKRKLFDILCGVLGGIALITGIFALIAKTGSGAFAGAETITWLVICVLSVLVAFPMFILRVSGYADGHARRGVGSTVLHIALIGELAILCLVLGIIGSLPTLILQWAIAASDASVAVGDPTDLPPYVHGLSFFFIIFATAFATLSTLYGWIAGFLHIHSVFAKERDRLNRQDKR